MPLAWLPYTQSACSFSISFLAQISEAQFSTAMSTNINYFKSITRYALQIHLLLVFPKVPKNTLHIIGYSDSSLAKNCDLSFQAGSIILLGYHTDSVTPLGFSSPINFGNFKISKMIHVSRNLRYWLRTLSSRYFGWTYKTNFPSFATFRP